MWTIDENVNDVNPWNADEGNEATHDDLNGINEDGPGNLDESSNGVVQARRFAGMGRYDEFSRFTKQHSIGMEDVVSIADDPDKLELVLFYVA